MDVYSRVYFFDWDHYMAVHMIIGELFARSLNTTRLFCELFTVDHFILQLDVSQLVFQLGWVGSFDYLVGWCEDHFKYKVIV